MKNRLWPFLKHDKFEIVKEILEDNNSVVVLDTNILFNLYRNTESDSKVFIKFIEKYKDHLVLPYTIGREFIKGKDHILKKESIRNLNDKISKHTKCIENLESGLKELDNLPDNFNEELDLNDLNKATEDIIKKITKRRTSLRSQLTKEKKKINTSDWIVDKVFEIFEGKIWNRLSSEEIKEIEIEGKIRYKSYMPPGFKDSDKPNNKFGDLFLWKEILKNCKGKKTLFVTDDTKKDWYHTDEKKSLTPHPLLLEEYLGETSEKCYLVTFAEFMEIHKQIHGDESKIDNLNIESWIKTINDSLNSKETRTEIARLNKELIKTFHLTFPTTPVKEMASEYEKTIKLLGASKWVTEQQKLQNKYSQQFNILNNALSILLKNKDRNKNRDEDRDEDDLVSID